MGWSLTVAHVSRVAAAHEHQHHEQAQREAAHRQQAQHDLEEAERESQKKNPSADVTRLAIRVKKSTGVTQLTDDCSKQHRRQPQQPQSEARQHLTQGMMSSETKSNAFMYARKARGLCEACRRPINL